MHYIAKKFLVFIFLLSLTESIHGEYLSLEDIGNLKLQEKSTLIKHSKSCGDFYVLQNNDSRLDVEPDYLQYFSYGGDQVMKYKRKGFLLKKQSTETFSYKTPNGQVFINQARLNGVSYGKFDKYLKKSLLIQLRERAKNKLKYEFSEANDLVLPNSEKLVKKIEKTLFKSDEKNESKQIRVILAFFPELVDEIIYDETDELRPLLCLMKLKDHNIKMFNRWTNLLIPPAIGLGIAAAAVGSAGTIIPPLAIAAGVSACLLGIRDIGMGIHWAPTREQSAYAAGKMLLFYKEARTTMKNLQSKQYKHPLNEDEAKLLQALEELNVQLSHDRERTLKKLVRAKHFNRLLIIFGVLNAGFNGVNLTGDPTILADLPGTIFSTLGLK